MSPTTQNKVEVLSDPQALSRRVADWILGLAKAKQGIFSVVLSGGSTPRRLYERLAESPYREVFPWSRTHWFWGDERFVPRGDARSNYRMVQEALLSRAPIPAGNIHPVPTEGVTPEAAALAYERDLKLFYGAERLEATRPLFDVVLLGLGEDGHTASLFPGGAALGEAERWVVAAIGADSVQRITLTYPALESSAHAAFLVEGEAKRDVFRRVQLGGSDLPAARFHPANGVIWFVDQAAAGETQATDGPDPSP